MTATSSVALEINKSKWPKNMSIGTSPIGGNNYKLASVMCPVVNKYAGTNMVPENTGGNVHNVQLVNAGQIDLAMATTGIALEAWNGKAEWTKGKKFRNFRSLVVMEPFVVHFYTLKKYNIEKLQDLNGKVVSLNRVGSASHLWGVRILETLGIKPQKIVAVSPADSNNLLKDGVISAALCMGTPPHTAVISLQATNPVTVISFSEAEVKKLMDSYPGLLLKASIPAGSFKEQPNDILSVAQYDLLLASSSLPDDMVYMIVKSIFENKKELASGFKPLGHLDPFNVSNDTIPLHPGAYLYYQEIKAMIPEEAMPMK